MTRGRAFRLVGVAMAGVITFGCSSELNVHQKRALREWDARGLKVEEVHEETAFQLGFLFGIGSFYAGQPGTGVAALVTWPVSMVWNPIVARQQAEAFNYWATRRQVDDLERRDLEDLDYRQVKGDVSRAQYVRERAHIKEKYSGLPPGSPP